MRWWVLALAAVVVSSSYYEDDVIGPIADLLHRQRGFTQSQLGMLNGVISIPNVALALFNGVMIDRYGPARIALWSAAIGVLGAALTAIGTPYELMVAGRFMFGVSEGAVFIALVAGLAQWFSRSGIALAPALYLSLARVGSYAGETEIERGGERDAAAREPLRQSRDQRDENRPFTHTKHKAAGHHELVRSADRRERRAEHTDGRRPERDPCGSITVDHHSVEECERHIGDADHAVQHPELRLSESALPMQKIGYRPDHVVLVVAAGHGDCRQHQHPPAQPGIAAAAARVGPGRGLGHRKRAPCRASSACTAPMLT